MKKYLAVFAVAAIVATALLNLSSITPDAEAASGWQTPAQCNPYYGPVPSECGLAEAHFDCTSGCMLDCAAQGKSCKSTYGGAIWAPGGYVCKQTWCE